MLNKEQNNKKRKKVDEKKRKTIQTIDKEQRPG
jgi:hypothetical protein